MMQLVSFRAQWLQLNEPSFNELSFIYFKYLLKICSQLTVQAQQYRATFEPDSKLQILTLDSCPLKKETVSMKPRLQKNTKSKTIYFSYLITYTARSVTRKLTRQLSNRKEDRAMHPIYGCPKKFWESSLCTQLLFKKFVMDFCSDRY